MALSSSILEPYQEWEPRLVVVLTVVLLILDGIVTLYHTSFVQVLSHWSVLSPGQLIMVLAGSYIVEPVLLFVTLYLVSRRFERQVPLLELLPGLIGAVVVGYLLGQLTGGEIWGALTPLDFVVRGNAFSLSPPLMEYWLDIVFRLVRDLLTAVAALGLARS